MIDYKRASDIKLSNVEFQPLQFHSSSSEQVELHELELTRLTIFQTCGQNANTPSHWYHELVMDFEEEQQILNPTQLNDIVKKNKLTIGTEWGIMNRGIEIDVFLGTKTHNYMAVGEINTNYYSDNTPHCIGGEYTDRNGNLHKNALVHAIYKLKWFRKITTLKESTVPIDGDHTFTLSAEEKSKSHYSHVNGKNYYVTRVATTSDTGSDKCDYTPTRDNILKGVKATDGGRSVFVSDENKSLFILKEEIEICGCKSYKTSYPGLLLRPIGGDCSPRPYVELPAQSVNKEDHDNIKVILC